MEQSPTSKRSKSPSEKPPSDNNPYSEQGGQTGKHGPSARGPQVPSLDFGRAGHQGGVQSGPPSMSTNRPAPIPAGSAGYASDPEDAKRTGGSVERFANDRGQNS